MTKVSFEGVGKFSYHYPRVATVVTCHAKGKDNAMAVAWHAPISFTPPLYGVSIALKRFTYQLILEAGEFGVNFLPLQAAELIASVGGSKGSEMDKFERFHIAKEKPLKTAVPILKEAYASYECKLVDHRTYGDHEWFVGEIVAVHSVKEAFTEKEVLDLERVAPALYLGEDLYLTASKATIRHLDRMVYGKR